TPLRAGGSPGVQLLAPLPGLTLPPAAGRAPALARPCQRLSVLLRGAGRRLAQLLQGLRQHSRHITRSVLFRLGVVVVVCVHTLMLVAQTFAAIQIRGGTGNSGGRAPLPPRSRRARGRPGPRPAPPTEWFFSVLDAVFLCVYVVEALVKLAAFGLDYFRDPWNDIGEAAMSLLRLLRIFKGVRAFRLVHLMLSLRLACLVALTFPPVIFSVLLRDLFARSDPGRFGHLLDTVFTLFQLLTLDDWSFIYRDSAQQGASYIIIFLMAYILIEYFTFLK
ncbi:cation channel sperm-associated protein 1, partial [Alligator sinensis]|uniref:Cation channel sperm-associated protein 1 n=1 Tax=Alligator sinensis TaxID=38654 RepID=A0A3Q0HFH0_ALLSI